MPAEQFVCPKCGHNVFTGHYVVSFSVTLIKDEKGYAGYDFADPEPRHPEHDDDRYRCEKCYAAYNSETLEFMEGE